MSWTDHHMAVNTCRVCGLDNDAASAASGERPRDGDVSICIRCATISQFNADGTLREPTMNFVNGLVENEDLRSIVYAVHKLPFPTNERNPS